jgi:TonB family protein
MKTPRSLPALSLALVLACTTGATPPSGEIVTLPEIEFPTQMLHRGVTTGEVHVLVKISPDARLLDALVTAYTHKAFAEATLAALPHSTFRPLLVDGQPAVTLTEVVVRFESSGMLAVERFAGDHPDLRPGKYAYEPCDPGRLDRPLQPIAVRSPDYPKELGEQGVQGSVVLEYYVDETGHVRMPRVSAAGHEALASLSLAAVEQWQFQPPSSRSKPVLVRVRQQFDFVPKARG